MDKINEKANYCCGIQRSVTPDYAVSYINPTILAAETAFYLALKRDFFTF